MLRACPDDVRRAHADEIAAIAAFCVDSRAAGQHSAQRWRAELRALADLTWFVIDARRARRRAKRRPLFMLQDVRATFRQLRARPLFAAAVILMLGLGIGATTAIFSVVNRVLLTPLALGEPDRIAEVVATIPSRGIDEMVWSEANMWDLIDQNRSFEALAGVHAATLTLTGTGDPERVQGSRVTAGFFAALGVEPIAGRFFEKDAGSGGGPPDLVVISDRFWARHFDRDPSVIGRAMQLDGLPRRIVGVVGDGPVWLETRDVFVPMFRRADANRGSWEYSVFGRLRPGVTRDAAQADLARVMDGLRQYKDNDGMLAEVHGIDAWIASPELRRTLWIMLASVLLLLLIAAVNVTNLLFVRAAARAHERAVRTALGAARADLVRESLTESMVLSALGALVGWGIAALMLAAFKQQDPGGIPRLTQVSLDATVFIFTLGVAAVVGLATGLAPAWRQPFGSLTAGLRAGQRGAVGDRQQDRLRAAFVIVEVAVSVVLVVAAGLLVRSLHNVLTADRGFATENRLTAEVSIPGSYAEDRRDAIATSLVERIGALPEVERVAAVSGPMLAGGGTGMFFTSATGTETQAPWATWRFVTSDYFDTIGLHLLAGRQFTEADGRDKAWRVIVTDRLAERVWPNENPVGKTATLWKGQGNLSAEVIGVVSDLREHRLDDAPTMTVYMAGRGAMGGTTLRLVMHTRVAPESAAPALRNAVASVDPSLPVSRIQTIEALVARSVATRRFSMQLLATFAGFAAVLALAGVAGVLAYAMSRRRREFGLRLALGASYSQLLARAVRAGMTPVAIGLALGMVAAWTLARLMTSLLFGITASDPLTYLGVGAGLVFAALAACYGPARRVMAIDPAEALRNE
jgi:predicted permease